MVLLAMRTSSRHGATRPLTTRITPGAPFRFSERKRLQPRGCRMKHPFRRTFPLPRWAYVSRRCRPRAPIPKRSIRSRSGPRPPSAAMSRRRHPAIRYGIALNDTAISGSAEVLQTFRAAAPHGVTRAHPVAAFILIATRSRLLMRTARRASISAKPAELTALGIRKRPRPRLFSDGFPTEAFAALLKTRLARPTLSEADWAKSARFPRT